MGIKVEIRSSQLPLRYQKYKLIPTTQGVMASVYLLGELYVLKLFDKETPLITIDLEIELLSCLQELPTPNVVEQFQIEGYEVVVFTQIKGDMPSIPTLKEIQQIGIFLKHFHTQSKTFKFQKEKLFSRNRLRELIRLSKNKMLQYYFDSIKLTLYNDGIIHGDLFPDNCKFLEGRLSGVYDFSDASMGDFNFELAVVTIAWCFDGVNLNQEKMHLLLDAYEYKRESRRERFLVYVKYALLYYATTRFLAKRDYMELLNRLKKL